MLKIITYLIIYKIKLHLIVDYKWIYNYLFTEKDNINKKNIKRNNEDYNITRFPLSNFKHDNKFIINIIHNNNNNTSFAAYHSKNINFNNNNKNSLKNKVFSKKK